MWELDCKECWAPKNWYFWTVVLEKTLESPLGCKEIQPVHPKRRSVLAVLWKDWCEAETLILWTPDSKSWLIWKDPDAGKDLRQEEKKTTGWDRWMASPTQWTWVWVDSGSWWWTGRPGVLQSMGSQRVRHDWPTELNWTELTWLPTFYLSLEKSKKSYWKKLLRYNVTCYINGKSFVLSNRKNSTQTLKNSIWKSREKNA